jgi:hypothetical protein
MFQSAFIISRLKFGKFLATIIKNGKRQILTIVGCLHITNFPCDEFEYLMGYVPLKVEKKDDHL